MQIIFSQPDWLLLKEDIKHKTKTAKEISFGHQVTFIFTFYFSFLSTFSFRFESIQFKYNLRFNNIGVCKIDTLIAGIINFNANSTFSLIWKCWMPCSNNSKIFQYCVYYSKRKLMKHSFLLSRSSCFYLFFAEFKWKEKTICSEKKIEK